MLEYLSFSSSFILFLLLILVFRLLLLSDGWAHLDSVDWLHKNINSSRF